MKPAIRALVIDDESSARRRVLQFLVQEDDIQVVGECCNGLEACADIQRLAPDLVFLDVEMPAGNGFEVLGQVGAERMPATIFVTAHNHYALSAFDANAVDYLLKPFDQARFTQALTRARTRIASAQLAHYQVQLGTMLRDLSAEKKFPERILVRAGDNQQLLKVADILYVTAAGNYVGIHTSDGQFTLRERMVGMQERLDPATFRRIHRSHIVNLNHIAKILPWFGGDQLVMMADGCRLNLSRNYRDAIADFG